MGLVTSKEIAKTIKVDKFGFVGTFIGWSLMKALRISACNKIYDKHKHLQDLEFVNALLEEFEVKFEIPEEDLKRLPKNGAFITISNHPLGGIDGILLLKIALEQRADFKIIANFLLHRVEPLKPYVMPVNPFENKKDVKSSLAGFKSALKHVQDGHPLGIFPAGEVSTYREDKQIIDKPWEEAAMKLIKKAEVPVVPIYFHAKNSLLFYKLAKMNDVFRTAKLPSELLSQRERTIKIRIGNPISVNDQKEQESLQEFSAFLRKKTYMLANTFKKKTLLDNIPKNLKLPKAPKTIITPVAPHILEREVESLLAMDKRLLVSKNYEVYLAEAELIPNILQELGRLREITFREVGEGTNQAIDLDSFDTYYHHMFLWDSEAKKMAGAYRMGLGSHIFAKYGIDCFYLQA
nr:lysophospholipid acyltransferase family protein [Flavobacteriales bacterium]